MGDRLVVLEPFIGLGDGLALGVAQRVSIIARRDDGSAAIASARHANMTSALRSSQSNHGQADNRPGRHTCAADSRD
jgi:hypothetical protein